MSLRKWATVLLFALTIASIVILKRHGTATTESLSKFDPRLPFQLDFGRGSVLGGMDVISVREDGHVPLMRRTPDTRERATMRLQKSDLAKIADAIATHGLIGLTRVYTSETQDGTQWAIWIRQAGQQKTVWFSNNFPPEIRGFAAALDAVLDQAGRQELEWQRGGSNFQEVELNAAIRADRAH